jgi:hypothetical protein
MLSKWKKKFTRIHDEFKDRSEIKIIIENLSSIKRDDERFIVEDGRSSH